MTSPRPSEAAAPCGTAASDDASRPGQNRKQLADMTIQSDAEIIDTDASVSRKAKAAAQSSPVGAQPYDVPLPMDFPPRARRL